MPESNLMFKEIFYLSFIQRRYWGKNINLNVNEIKMVNKTKFRKDSIAFIFPFFAGLGTKLNSFYIHFQEFQKRLHLFHFVTFNQTYGKLSYLKRRDENENEVSNSDKTSEIIPVFLGKNHQRSKIPL